MTRTPEELDDLKANWTADPCWDIADTAGFEDHRDELEAYQKAHEAKQAARATEQDANAARYIGCPDFPELAGRFRAFRDDAKHHHSIREREQSVRAAESSAVASAIAAVAPALQALHDRIAALAVPTPTDDLDARLERLRTACTAARATADCTSPESADRPCLYAYANGLSAALHILTA